MKRTIKDLTPAPTGYTHLVVGPYCWGKDAEPAKALANAKREMPRSYFPTGFRPAFHVLQVTDDCYVNDMGGINVPLGGSLEWLGAYGSTGIRRDDVENPYN